MNRVQLISSVSFGLIVVTASLSPASASLADDARRVCAERYTREAASGTVPYRMSKSRYLSQCTTSYIRTEKLNAQPGLQADQSDDDFDAEVSGDDRDGIGGPEILEPGANAEPIKKKPSIVAPKAIKPSIP